MRVTRHETLDPALALRREQAGLTRLSSGNEELVLWESPAPCVIAPRAGPLESHAFLPACQAEGVPVVRRESGGGSVVLGPGCLNYSFLLSLDERPWLADVAASYRLLLSSVAAALTLGGVEVHGTDLALGRRKFAGHAQRRTRQTLLHHGTILYALDLEWINRLLPEPDRRPAYRGKRTHQEFLTNLPLPRGEIEQRLASFAAKFARTPRPPA